MFVTIINDCTDDNVKGRLGTRVAALFGVTPSIVSVGGQLQSKNTHDPAEYEAAGCLIDVLDSANDAPGIVLINVANRHGKGKKWPNGTPFGYFYNKNILVVSTIDGLTLSLVKKLQLVNSIQLLDIPTIVNQFLTKNILNKQLADQIINTQFRSLEFEPRVAKWIMEKYPIPSTDYSISEIESISSAVWYVDNFGNCKTTLLPDEISFAEKKQIQTTFGLLNCYTRLKDVPDNEKALIIGSSGYDMNRFVELVIQGKSAAQQFSVIPSSKII